MTPQKKFICIRCNVLSKRHSNIEVNKGLCKDCEMVIGKEILEARQLDKLNLPIPNRLMYLYISKQLSLEE